MNKRIDRMKKCALTPVAMLLFAAMASAQSYYVLNLGVLPGQTDSFAAGINSSGTVVGHSGNNAFAWTLQNCSMTQLGHVVSGRASAAAISNQGKIVGSVTDAPDRQRAFSYDGGVISDLGGPANLNTSATAISRWHIPVGVERIPLSKDLKWAVYYLYDQAHELPSVVANPPFPHPFVQSVTGVNDLLQVTGFLFDSAMNAIGFVSAPNFGTWTRIQG